jgi:DNA modification methylase
MKQGRIYFTKNGIPRVKKFLDELKGNPIRDIWNDINPVTSSSNERIGYKTQKPEALLERIIKASSNEGDIVLDCFVGGGTTCAVANKLGRKWIGIDINPNAIEISKKRIYL